MIRGFTEDPEVIGVGAEFLRIISWNFVATGIVFTNSSMFQAMGNTMPALMASATRILTFALPAIWLTTLSSFELRHLWFLSVGTVALQACVSWWMLSGEFRKRLGGAPESIPLPAPPDTGRTSSASP
jgi:Na+-driven multidrug efflux pump